MREIIQRHRAVLPAKGCDSTALVRNYNHNYDYILPPIILVYWSMVCPVNFVYFCKSDLSAFSSSSLQAHSFWANFWHQSKARNTTSYQSVIVSNLGSILHRFGDIAAFMCS